MTDRMASSWDAEVDARHAAEVRERMESPALRLQHFLDTAPRKMLLDALYCCMPQHWGDCPEAWERIDDEPIKAIIWEFMELRGPATTLRCGETSTFMLDVLDLFSDVGWEEYNEAS